VRNHQRPDNADTVAERLRYRAAHAQASAEMLERFHPIDLANAEAAMEWRAARVRELFVSATNIKF
jgi:hypothetical protein